MISVALLNEWFTGRLPDGSESPRFASRWKDARAGRFKSRSYVPNLADVRGFAARPGFRVSVNLKAGADGATELRFDVVDKTTGARTVETWRPVTGSLDGVLDRGAPRHERVARVRNPSALANADRASELDVGDAGDAAAAVRAEVAILREQLEAQDIANDKPGAAQTRAKINALTAKREALRARSSTLRGAR